MGKNTILTKYLLPTMGQISLIAILAYVLRFYGVKLGYDSPVGIILIVIAGVSSAVWAIVYQCRFGGKGIAEIAKDFIAVRQPIKVYFLVIVFLLLYFGSVIINQGFQIENAWLPVILFLKAIAFGGIEEIGWRYTFQPDLERKIPYIPAVLLTFLCWGIWHFLFFSIDGSIAAVNIPLFLFGLLTNCFVLSALYAYSGSLWICVMTHALINAFSQLAINDNVIIGIVLKIVCMIMAVALFYVSKKKLRHSERQDGT